MNIVIALLFTIYGASAFAPTNPATFGVQKISSRILVPTMLAAEPSDEEEEGLDLNLEEMFDMYVNCFLCCRYDTLN